MQIGLSDIGKHELGMIICKVCNKLIGTLPTDGVRKMYGICSQGECIRKESEAAGNDD